MSLSPLVSFKSRFVTCLLNFPRTYMKVLPDGLDLNLTVSQINVLQVCRRNNVIN